MRRRLAVILMADMVDYTAAMEADQAGTIGLIRELRERWLEPEAERRSGEVLKRMGDGWIIAFPSVTEAVETARAVQSALAGHDRIRLRMAAHLGEIAEDEADLYGTGINITARLQSEAPPGGVMISEDLHRQLDTKLAADFGDAGTFELKNIAYPVQGWQWRPQASGRPARDEVPVIAVEPFAASPSTSEAGDAAADLTEQIVERLGRRTGIRVLALDRAGGDSSVEPTYVLRGRLRVRGENATVSATFTLRETGQVTWSGNYDGTADDLYGLSDFAAGRLDTQLRQIINALDGERLAAIPDDALSAGELRARASQMFYETTIEGYERAVELLDRGLRLTPDNAMCKGMWCHARLMLSLARFRDMDPGLAALVVARANEAVQAAPRSDWCFMNRGSVRLCVEGDLVGARRDLERTRQINPGFHFNAYWSGMLALAEGRYGPDASELPETYPGLASEPFRPGFAYVLAVGALLDDRMEDALGYLVDAIELRPSCRAYRLLLAETHARMGNEPEAAEARAAAARLSGRPDILVSRIPLPEADAWLMDLVRPDEA